MPTSFDELKTMFSQCREGITAIGDENRQEIIIALLGGGCEGMRVGEITTRTRLSRPAVSHHLKVLCDANILTVRRAGTMNFYSLNPDREGIMRLMTLCQKILDLMDGSDNMHQEVVT